jgi:hypothetical protein
MDSVTNPVTGRATRDNLGYARASIFPGDLLPLNLLLMHNIGENNDLWMRSVILDHQFQVVRQQCVSSKSISTLSRNQ